MARLAAVLTLFVSAPALAGPFTESGYAPTLMSAWATAVDDLLRGPLDIAMPGLGNASFGAPENALGPATADNMDVCSLGDGGHLTLFFESGISDGPGDDFAVYENGFFVPSSGGLFAEFAYVEVSTNGVDFARFLATSLQPTPVSSFDVIDPTDYHNLGGKHALGLGTGFDLAELSDDPLVQSGDILLDDIRYVRLVDVVGDGSTFDSAANPVYDAYPTAFATGGFDVEAVGVLHVVPEAGSVEMLLAGIGGLYTVSRGRRRAHRCPRGE